MTGINEPKSIYRAEKESMDSGISDEKAEYLGDYIKECMEKMVAESKPYFYNT